MNDLVVTIRSLNRTNYLKQCLASLEANIGLDDVDFYLYQDGAVNPYSGIRYATDEQINASLMAFYESNLPNKITKIKDHNVGTAIQKTEMLTELLPQYRFVMMLDNDLVFSRYYIKTIKTLFRQFEDHPGIGMLQTSYFYRGDADIETLEKAKEFEDKVAFGFGHRWEQGFWRSKWGAIWEEYRYYAQHAQNYDYKWVINKYCIPSEMKPVLDHYGGLSGDYVLERCVEMAGLEGIYTLALRHKTIGKDGLYADADKFDREGFGRILIHDIGNIDRYELCQ